MKYFIIPLLLILYTTTITGRTACDSVAAQLGISDLIPSDTTTISRTIRNRWKSHDFDIKKELALLKDVLACPDFENYSVRILLRTLRTELLFKSGDERGLGYEYYYLALRHSDASNYHQSYNCLIRSIDIAKKYNDSLALCKTHGRMAWIFHHINRSEDALVASKQYYKYGKARKDSVVFLSRYYNLIANIYSVIDSVQLAKKYGTKAIKYAKLSKSDLGLAIVRSNRLQYYTEGDSIDYRIAKMKEIIHHNSQSNYVNRLKSNYRLLGSFYQVKGSYLEAIDAFELAVELCIRLNDLSRLYSSYKGLAACYDSLDMHKEANYYYSQLPDIKDDIYDDNYFSTRFNTEIELNNKIQEQNLKLAILEQEHLTNEIQRQKHIGIFLLMIAALGFLVYIAKNKNKQINKELSYIKKQNDQLLTIQELERKSLRAQMNPHFIFNSLNSIKSYIIENETRDATNYLNKFAKLIRKILYYSEKEFISLANELELLTLYIELEELRIGKNITFTINTNKVDLNSSVPPLILQPFVENAIWHGLISKNGAKAIELTLSNEADHIRITIKDNGIGRRKSRDNKTTSSHKSMGVEITRSRLRLMANSDDRKEFEPITFIDHYSQNGEATGTEVVVKINKKKYEKISHYNR